MTLLEAYETKKEEYKDFADVYEQGWKDAVERYRWHDLRKDPNDLPTPETEVDVVCERHRTDKTYIIRTHGIYEDGTILENDSVWLWEDIDGEYNEEEDCFVVPKGWWEYRHYNVDEVYNNVIDDKVIAWRDVVPFEECVNE